MTTQTTTIDMFDPSMIIDPAVQMEVYGDDHGMPILTGTARDLRQTLPDGRYPCYLVDVDLPGLAVLDHRTPWVEVMDTPGGSVVIDAQPQN